VSEKSDSKLGKFLKLGTAQKLLLFESLIMLALAEISNRYRQFRKNAPTLGSQQASDFVVKNKDHLQQSIVIGNSVSLVASHLPWDCVCLPQAMAVKWMLSRRDIASAVYFGAIRRDKTDIEYGSVDAHAWVGIANRVIIGGAKSKDYKVLAVFS